MEEHDESRLRIRYRHVGYLQTGQDDLATTRARDSRRAGRRDDVLRRQPVCAAPGRADRRATGQSRQGAQHPIDGLRPLRGGARAGRG